MPNNGKVCRLKGQTCSHSIYGVTNGQRRFYSKKHLRRVVPCFCDGSFVFGKLNGAYDQPCQEWHSVLIPGKSGPNHQENQHEIADIQF